MNTKDKIERLLHDAIDLIPYLSNTSDYNRFNTILKQVQRILKQNAVLKATNDPVKTWEAANVTWGDVTWGDYDNE